MSILNLTNMNVNEKMMAMEELWENMSNNINSNDLVPSWHTDILDNLEKKEQDGQLNFNDFELAKKELESII